MEGFWGILVEQTRHLSEGVIFVPVLIVMTVLVLSIIGVAVPASRPFLTQQTKTLVSPFIRKRKK